MRKHIWLLSGLLVLAAAAPSRADFTVRLGGVPATDVPAQNLLDTGDATIEVVHGGYYGHGHYGHYGHGYYGGWGTAARIAVNSVRFGLAVGATAAGYRPYYGYGGGYRPWGGYWGGYRPYYRPYYYAGYRPWYGYGYRPYYAAYRPWYGSGYYSSYYYPSYYAPSYSYYDDPYYYGVGGYGAVGTNSYAAPPPNVYNGAPVMPLAPDADGTYPYDGGPGALPYPDVQPTKPQPRPSVPREGKIVLLNTTSPAPIYPAYGEQAATTSSAVRVASQPARINYPAYGESRPVQTVVVRGGAE